MTPWLPAGSRPCGVSDIDSRARGVPMKTHNRFYLIAVIIVLPSIFGAGSYFYSARRNSDGNQQIAGNPARGAGWRRPFRERREKRRALSPGIAAMAIRRDDGVVVFSNARGLAKGESISQAQLLERVTSAYPDAGYIAESVSGEPGGSYVAVVESEPGPWYMDLHVIGSRP